MKAILCYLKFIMVPGVIAFKYGQCSYSNHAVAQLHQGLNSLQPKKDVIFEWSGLELFRQDLGLNQPYKFDEHVQPIR